MDMGPYFLIINIEQEMKRSYLYLHTAVLLGGFTGILGKLISIDAFALVWFRVFFASILLYTLLKVTGHFKALPRKEALPIALKAIYPALFWVFFYASVKYANVSVAVVCFCLTSFFTALIGPLVHKRKFSLNELLLSALILAGVGLIFHFDTSYRLGIGLGVISSFFGALYVLENERLVKRHAPAMISYYQLIGATVELSLILPVFMHFQPGASLVPVGMDWFYLILLALFCTVIMNWLMVEALKKVSAFTVNISYNLEPVYSIVLAFLIFKENRELNGSFYLGLSLILLSVILQIWEQNRFSADNLRNTVNEETADTL
jgi:drug/metabolite transporter (DMT)-like permease